MGSKSITRSPPLRGEGASVHNQELTQAFLSPRALNYHIYSINRPGRLSNFSTLRVDANSRWALIRGWALIEISPFSASAVCLFLQQNNKW